MLTLARSAGSLQATTVMLRTGLSLPQLLSVCERLKAKRYIVVDGDRLMLEPEGDKWLLKNIGQIAFSRSKNDMSPEDFRADQISVGMPFLPTILDVDPAILPPEFRGASEEV